MVIRHEFDENDLAIVERLVRQQLDTMPSARRVELLEKLLAEHRPDPWAGMRDACLELAERLDRDELPKITRIWEPADRVERREAQGWRIVYRTDENSNITRGPGAVMEKIR